MDQDSDDEAARDLAPQQDRRQHGPEDEEPASLALPVQPALHPHGQIFAQAAWLRIRVNWSAKMNGRLDEEALVAVPGATGERRGAVRAAWSAGRSPGVPGRCRPHIYALICMSPRITTVVNSVWRLGPGSACRIGRVSG